VTDLLSTSVKNIRSHILGIFILPQRLHCRLICLQVWSMVAAPSIFINKDGSYYDSIVAYALNSKSFDDTRVSKPHLPCAR